MGKKLISDQVKEGRTAVDSGLVGLGWPELQLAPLATIVHAHLEQVRG